MLDKSENHILHQTQSYLNKVLDITAHIEQIPYPPQLPYYLRNAYLMAEASLLGRRVLFLEIKDIEAFTPSQLRRHIDQFRQADDESIPVFIFSKIDAFLRRQLILNRIAFIVPDNQLYIPQLAMDLRERFPSPRQLRADQLFSPATQALLIAALLKNHSSEEWKIAESAKEFGYTPMTVTRAVRELSDAQLINTELLGRKKFIRFACSRDIIWEKIEHKLRNPVIKEVRISIRYPIPTDAMIAGESALSELTEINPPSSNVWAISSSRWAIERLNGATSVNSREDSMIWQIWSYTPHIRYGDENIQSHDGQYHRQRFVDPISLLLSLRGEKDERIMIACDELRRQLPWK